MFTKLANEKNYSQIRRRASDIKYVVIHYTGNNGDTARNNLNYFHENKVSASAHFFVDEKETCCSVPWDNIAWHCGAKKYIHDECRNANSIGIEICSRKDSNGEYYFHNNAVKLAAQLTAQQMKNYNIPIYNVVRHYDVTGKICPAPFMEESEWKAFKDLVVFYYQQKVGDRMTYFETLEEVPAGQRREVVSELIEKGVIKGNANGLHLSDDMCRMFVFMKRLNLF